MRNFRSLVVAFVALCALTLGGYVLARKHVVPLPAPGDDIIIKGGSLEIQCGTNHGTNCLGAPDSYGKYKHTKKDAHILHMTVTDQAGAVLYSGNFDKDHQPTVAITYK
jgi:hypothetical protein